jgi:ubiquinone/menaquinone biosynthesis C-methylase UbiE
MLPVGQSVCVPKEQTSQYWDDQVATFDEEPDHGLHNPAVREAWRRALRSSLPEPPADIVDLGCGTGSLSVLLAEDGHRVTGIDLSAKMIDAATAKAVESKVAATFRVGDASEPDLDRASVDAIVVRHVVWALPAPGDAIRRWVTFLREGGRIVFIEGRWSTGAGITARHLEEIVRPILRQCEVRPLTEANLWGGPIDDERYMLVARP